MSADISGSDEDDDLYEDARELVLTTKKASATFLQRKLGIGYARAARLIDMLEERGVVGPGQGAKPREIYDSGIPQIEEAPLANNDNEEPIV